MGSSAVVNSRFKYWPYKKKIFQISHVKKINKPDIKTIFIHVEKPIFKILKLPEMIFQISQYFKNTKKRIIILEGASWIFYSFIVMSYFKVFSSNTKIIYISHSVESEIRKKFSNKFIFILTKFLEKLVFKFSDISTSVSLKEKRQIKSLYNVNTILLPNGIHLDQVKKKKIISEKYIIYTGSYKYKPNKDAIDYINNILMPVIIQKNSNFKFVITGGGFDKEYPWVINKGIVKKKNYITFFIFQNVYVFP